MKVYTKIVLDMADGRILEEESYEYDGPVAEAKGTVNVPPPSAEEKGLMQKQIDLLTQQQAIIDQQLKQQNLLQPLFYEAAGIEPVMDEAGNILSFKRRDPTQAEQSAEEILNLQLQRSKAALAGELPLDPALLRSLDEEETELRDFLRQRFGPDFETASPAIEALAEQRKRKNEILASARRGDISLFEGLSMAREGGIQRQTDLFLTRGAGTAGLNAPVAAAFGQTASGFGAPISFLRDERLTQAEAAIQTARNKEANRAALISSAVGIGLGAAGGAFLGPAVGLSSLGGAAVGAGGGLGTLPFLNMRRR